MNKHSLVFGALLLVLALLHGGALQAQYAVETAVIAGGGGSSTAAGFSLNATLGAPDAATSTAGSFAVKGGFWNAALFPGANNCVAVLDYVRLNQGTSATLQPLANDIGTGLVLLSVSTSSHASLSLSNFSIGYTPNPDFTGMDVLHYTAMDAGLCIVTGAIVLAVEPQEASTVNMEFREVRRNNTGSVRGLYYVTDVAVSADGRFAYACGQYDNSIAVFRRNTSTGSLTFVSRVENGRGGVRDISLVSAIALSPDGRHLYATGYGNNTLVVFECDPLSGELYYIERKKQGKFDGPIKIDGLKSPIALAVSPDGRSVYVSGYNDHALAVFRRDLHTGRLQYLEQQVDGSGGVNGMRNPRGVSVSPDGKSVYVAGYKEKAVAVFSRHATAGTLSFVERLRDGVNGVDGINKAIAVSVSPDARHVYVAGYGDNALAVFERDTADGSLSFVHRLREGVQGVLGLNGIKDVHAAPDGVNIYTVADKSDALTVFQRNTANGELQYLERYRDGVSGIDGLNGAEAVFSSYDGKYVYCAGAADNAVSVFFRNRAPLTNPDYEATAQNAPLSITVLDNDSDPDGHSLQISGSSNGASGTVVVDGGNQSLTYTPTLNFSGSDFFTYNISDGHGGTGSDTVYITVGLLKQSSEDAVVPGERAESTPGRAESCLLCESSVSPVPSNGPVYIRFRLAEAARVSLRITDALGRPVYTQAVGRMPAGTHVLRWDAAQNGEAAGMYLGILEAEAARPEQQVLPILFQR